MYNRKIIIMPHTKNKSKNTLWRTLLRVTSVTNNHIRVIIPGWSTSERVAVKISEIPDKIFREIFPGKRIHARVNIGENNKSKLIFKDWEVK